jgi:hypothetical protein
VATSSLVTAGAKRLEDTEIVGTAARVGTARAARSDDDERVGSTVLGSGMGNDS